MLIELKNRITEIDNAILNCLLLFNYFDCS